MKITISSTQHDWDQFISSCAESTAYHQFAWQTVINKSFRHQCHYLAAIDEYGKWQGVLPLVHMQSRLIGNFLVSVPFVNYGGLLYNDENAATLLLNEAKQLRLSCKASHVELRHRTPYTREALPTKQHKVSMILNLADSTEIQWKDFNAKLRNQIRKAEKSDLQFTIGHLELLDDFYRVFSRNMRDLGTPVYGKKFFYHVLKTFSDTTRVIVIYYQNKAICAGILLWFNDTLEMPWASSISDYRALCPNNMLYWEAIKFGIARGFKKFDFGRSTPNEGTFNFKKQWGAVPINLHWQYLMDEADKLPDLNPANPKYQKAVYIWQRLPLPITRILGPLIIRNIP